jgi:hypothetical protein
MTLSITTFSKNNKMQHNDTLSANNKCNHDMCRYAECRYAECRYAECRYAECRRVNKLFKIANFLATTNTLINQ